MPIVPAVPDLYEKDRDASLEARTGSLRHLRELGPPDLVHFVKQSVKSNSKPFGVFHHVTGIDASSSASLAAYIYTIQQTSSDRSVNLISGTYCCYNAFSRLDMRVHVTIPGSVESSCVDERGEERIATDDLWLETYLCAVLRAYQYADDGSGEMIRQIVGMRRFNPITTESSERRFLQAAEKLFFNGWQLGSDLVTQVPNMVANNLTTTLLAYFRTTGRFQTGIDLFERLRAREPEVASLLARLYLLANEEVKAVQLLHDSIKSSPMDYALLDCQAEYCNRKGRPDMAVEVAKRAVIASPSEFTTWARLAEVYVNSEQWDLALLTLNACPMFTSQDTDLPRIPEPRKIVQPILPQSICPEMQDEVPDGEKVPESLRRLHAATLRGTFLRAYLILTEITKRIGWDPLLQIRSQIFVMEEEYRIEKQQTMQTGGPAVKSASSPSQTDSAVGPDKTAESEANGVANEPGQLDSDPDVEDDDESVADEVDRSDRSETRSRSSSRAMTPFPSLDSPPKAATPEPVKTTTAPPTAAPASRSDKMQARTPVDDGNMTADRLPDNHKLRNKRLCERWLDNLFMVLYEDLQVYSNWRTEVGPKRTSAKHIQLMQASRSSSAWELLGNLAARLHQHDDAIEAYQACLTGRCSPRAIKGIVNIVHRQHAISHHRAHPNARLTSQFDIYRHESPLATASTYANGHSSVGAITNSSPAVIHSLVRLIGWQYRWYSEFSPDLLYLVRTLIDEEGGVKIRSLIQSTSFPQSVRDLALGYVQLCSDFGQSDDLAVS